MQLTPYIMFDGNCEEALNFYVKCFGGEIKSLNYFEGSPMEKMAKDKKQVMHATFVAKDLVLMASDGGGQGGVEGARGDRIHLSLNFDTVGEEEKIYKALSEGGKQTMPLQDTFWGARFGMLEDKYGIHWMFNCEKKG